ncbi:riboflavin synthase [bacterium]|nr:riboflavin synthase [bacterium]
MFTGIVEELGKILFITKNKLTVEAYKVTEDAKIGDSIAVNGVCLTVTKINSNGFDADISPETSKVTTLGKLKNGSFVNLERALPADGRFGGHIVSGHIDGIGKICILQKDGDFYNLVLEISENESKYVVKKGSITVNGISLTVAEIDGETVKIAIIPHTFENTNLKELKAGDYVNIETDIISKYVEKFLSTRDNNTGISMQFLRENGF